MTLIDCSNRRISEQKKHSSYQYQHHVISIKRCGSRVGTHRAFSLHLHHVEHWVPTQYKLYFIALTRVLTKVVSKRKCVVTLGHHTRHAASPLSKAVKFALNALNEFNSNTNFLLELPYFLKNAVTVNSHVTSYRIFCRIFTESNSPKIKNFELPNYSRIC